MSYDLRTPLAAIAGAASSLLEESTPLDAPTHRELCQTIYEEAKRLNQPVNNLLDMTRLESGVLQVHKERQPLEEVVGAALARLDAQLGDHIGFDRCLLVPSLPSGESCVAGHLPSRSGEHVWRNILNSLWGASPRSWWPPPLCSPSSRSGAPPPSC